jgi:hypothetical protein
MEQIFKQVNIISLDECEILIDYQKNNSTNNEVGEFWNNRVVSSYNDEIRYLTDKIHGKIINMCEELYNKKVYLEFSNLVYWGVGMKLDKHADNHYIDNPQKLHYSPNRNYSSVLYLNDDFTGGETYFCNYNFEVKPESGTVILFSSGKDHIHGVNEVLSGERYTMSTWYTEDKNFEQAP